MASLDDQRARACGQGCEGETERTMKPGIKSTEFYIVAFVTVVGALVGSGLLPADSVYMKAGGAILAVAAALGYTLQRGGLKKAEAAKEVAKTEARVKVVEALKDKGAAERAAALAELK